MSLRAQKGAGLDVTPITNQVPIDAHNYRFESIHQVTSGSDTFDKNVWGHTFHYARAVFQGTVTWHCWPPCNMAPQAALNDMSTPGTGKGAIRANDKAHIEFEDHEESFRTDPKPWLPEKLNCPRMILFHLTCWLFSKSGLATYYRRLSIMQKRHSISPVSLCWADKVGLAVWNRHQQNFGSRCCKVLRSCWSPRQLWIRLFIMISVMWPILTLVRGVTDYHMEQKQYSSMCVSDDTIHTASTYGRVSQWAVSFSGSLRDEGPLDMASKRFSNCHSSKGKDNYTTWPAVRQKNLKKSKFDVWNHYNMTETAHYTKNLSTTM